MKDVSTSLKRKINNAGSSENIKRATGEENKGKLGWQKNRNDIFSSFQERKLALPCSTRVSMSIEKWPTIRTGANTTTYKLLSVNLHVCENKICGSSVTGCMQTYQKAESRWDRSDKYRAAP